MVIPDGFSITNGNRASSTLRTVRETIHIGASFHEGATIKNILLPVADPVIVIVTSLSQNQIINRFEVCIGPKMNRSHSDQRIFKGQPD